MKLKMWFNRKAQLVMYDFIFGFILFLVITTIISVTWFSMQKNTNNSIIYDAKLVVASQTIESLVATPGNPIHWQTNVSTYCISQMCYPGLSTHPGIIDNDKLNGLLYFTSIDDTGRLNTSLRLQGYAMRFLIRTSDGSEVLTFGSVENASIIATAKQAVLLNETPVVVEVSIG